MKPVSNPPNPWSSKHVEWLGLPPEESRVQLFEEEARSILSENDSPDVPFRWSLNAYRGCFHGCAYCYARPLHQYLDWGAGTDFERKIVVKTNAPQLLAKQFEKKSWQGETIALSGATDCYQPLEACYGLTRSCLEVCLRYRNPVGIITKGVLVRRDVDLLSELAAAGAISCVFMSIPFAESDTSRAIEPSVALPEARFDALADLSAAGVPTGIAIAPVIPALNDQDIPDLLRRARSAGASRAFMILLRLPGEVKAVFEERLRAEFPGRADHVLAALMDSRAGKLNESATGMRMKGTGPRWQATEALFSSYCRKLGLNAGGEEVIASSPFRRPDPQGQLFSSR